MKYLLLASVLIGCHSPHQEFVYDAEFTDEEVSALERAVDEWVYATDSQDAVIILIGPFRAPTFMPDAFFDYYETGRIFLIHKKEVGYELLKNDDRTPDYDYDGMHSNFQHNIVIRPSAEMDYADEFKEVFMHELGHLYGLDHQGGGLMAPSSNKGCIDWELVNSFCSSHDCGPNRQSTCDE